MPQFEIHSDLPIDAQDFLAAFDLQAVNYELGPFVQMSAPAAWRERAIVDWPTGDRLFTSWILLFGVLPVDLHSFGLEETWPDRGFSEASTSTTQRSWRHVREVVALPHGGSRITDRVTFQTYLPFGALLLPIYRAVFAWRHRRLRRRFGSAS